MMSSKVVYTSLSLSSVHILQGMAFIFWLVGLALAFQMAAAPVTSATSHVTHQGWAFALGAVAMATPVVAWLYSRRIVAQLAVSNDGRMVFIKSASLLGGSEDQWPVRELQLSSMAAGDTNGEETFGLPRITLTSQAKKQRRRYILELRNEEQLARIHVAFR